MNKVLFGFKGEKFIVGMEHIKKSSFEARVCEK